ncbi:hypothetical protein ACFWVF_22385 [Streptomyces sp. NPDC058659]|uniref:hypothetical protein n=1 Tax=unclassified Streptomyces TaxID=2593676 RepID=UPI003652264E
MFNWHLGYATRDPQGKIKELSLGGEAVSPDLADSHQEHLNILTEALENPPYAQLSAQYGKLFEALNELHSGNFPSLSYKEKLDPLPLLLDSFLSAFRAFDDRTCKWLSGRYEPNILNAFRTSLSHEYDTVFAYRFMYKLRNYSQHCGLPPISGHSSRWLDRDGVQRREVTVTFDSTELLRRFDKWGQPVKSELQDIAGEFSVVEMAAQLMASCTIAQAKLLLSISRHLQESADFLISCDRSPSGPQTVPVLIRVNPNSWRDPEGLRDLQLRYIRPELAHFLESSLRQSETILAEFENSHTTKK